MKKVLMSSVAVVGIATAAFCCAPASAAPIVLPTLPVWDSYDQIVGVGNFYPETWTTAKTSDVLITDIYVPGDNYNVYLNGGYLGTTNAADCTADGADGCVVGGSKYTYNGNEGWASPIFAHFEIFNVAPGNIVSISVATIPTGFSDSTVAITSVPEPSTWAMMLLGFAGLGFAGYRASRKSAVAA